MANYPVNANKSHKELSRKSFTALVSEFEKTARQLHESFLFESDAAVVLLGSIYIEECLRGHVTRLFNRLPKDQKDFHEDETSPLSIFRNYMLMAFKAYLIDEEMYKCIKDLQRIRNNVAHKVTKYNWQNDVKKLAKMLGAPQDFLPDDIEHIETAIVEFSHGDVASSKYLDSPERRLFLASVAWLLTVLELQLKSKAQIIPVTEQEYDEFLNKIRPR